jgi:hypothetical protein
MGRIVLCPHGRKTEAENKKKQYATRNGRHATNVPDWRELKNEVRKMNRRKRFPEVNRIRTNILNVTTSLTAGVLG